MRRKYILLMFKKKISLHTAFKNTNRMHEVNVSKEWDQDEHLIELKIFLITTKAAFCYVFLFFFSFMSDEISI